jgi:hypothetical protein
VPAIRVINEKQMLLITVGINVMLSCVKEYVKLAWEFICKPGREFLDFLQVKKSEMTGKTKKYGLPGLSASLIVKHFPGTVTDFTTFSLPPRRIYI